MLDKTQHHSRVVVVTGASAGLGRAIASRFSRSGDAVGLIARDESALQDFKSELEAEGGTVAYAVADVSDADEVMRAAHTLEVALGRIDVWVNNAMATVFSNFEDIEPKEFRRVTEVTYLGQVHGTMAALKHMRRGDRGKIIQIGSALAYRGIPLQSAYCGAKHAIRGFTNSVRAELIHANSKISLSVVEMPAMNTPQFDWARVHIPRQPRPAGGALYQPEACADAVFMAAGGPTREYWVGRSTMMTIVGNIIAPAYLDKYLARNAVAGQMRNKSTQPDREDNLFTPVSRFHRARGDFGDEAKNRATIIADQAARAGVIVLGALLFFALGAVVGAFVW